MMNSFKLTAISNGLLGRRENGTKTREKIKSLILENECIEIDLENTSQISPSFLEEAIVKLVTDLGKDDFKKSIKLININSSIRDMMNTMLASQIRRKEDIE